MSTHTAVSRLADLNVRRAEVLKNAARASVTNPSSCCGDEIQGTGPVRWCGGCGHNIPAADLNHEVQPGIADTIRAAITALPARHTKASSASAEIVEWLTAAIEAGDHSWATANAIVTDAHDNVTCNDLSARLYEIGLYEAAEITAALDLALRRIGHALTVTTPSDRVVVADAPRGYQAVTA